MKLFLLFYMRHFAIGLTHSYKTAVYLTFIFAVVLLNLTLVTVCITSFIANLRYDTQ